MAIFRPSIIMLSMLLLLSAVSASDSEAFFNCLVSHSKPSHPIFPAMYTPTNASYSPILQSYVRNHRFNTSTTPKPLLILTALHESHVQAAVLCSQKHELQMRIRSGGHDYEGVSYVSHVPFFVLDMFNLRDITLDMETQTAWVQAGATVGELSYKIANKSNTHGFPVSVCPTLAVGGFSSGGGYGNMLRKYGLSADHVIDAKLVDVKGKLLDRNSMGEDLFWAIRGGGAASFGVILAYKINIVRVPEKVTVFLVNRTLEQNATKIVYQYQHVAPKLDEDLFIRLTMDVVNGTKKGKKTVTATFRSLFLGNSRRLMSVMNKSFPELGLQPSDCKEMSWVQSVLYWSKLPTGKPEALLERTYHPVSYLKRKSDYVKEPIPLEGLELIWQRMIELKIPPKTLAVTFNPYGGRMAEISPTATPFPHRAGILFKVQYAADWKEGETKIIKHNLGMVRKLHKYMTPFVSKNPRLAYFNYRDLDIGINHHGEGSYWEGRVYGFKYFKENFDRLVQIKTRVDPANFFRNEQSIPTLPDEE